MGILIIIFASLGTLISANLALSGLIRGRINLSQSLEITGIAARIAGIISLVFAIGLGVIATLFFIALVRAVN